MSLIEIEGIEKRYDSHVVLRGVNLQVERGEVLVVIGPSGGGKSTLLALHQSTRADSERPDRG